MWQTIAKWLGEGAEAPSSVAASVPPGQRVYAVGDIHGCLGKLDGLLEKIKTDAAAFKGDVTLVFLGDYQNRGPSSKQVLDLLVEAPWPKAWKSVFLRGNHEQALLDFVADPAGKPDWLGWGGIETLASYEIKPFDKAGQPRGQHLLATELVEAMEPAGHLDFLNKTQMTHGVGGYLFVHAGVRPHVPMNRQLATDLMFIREDFIGRDHGLPYRVVHGHTIAPKVQVLPNRIGVDTGAYSGGPLSAVALEGKDVRVIQAHG